MDYIVEKLTHSSAEVRGRALESLEFKWKYGLIQADDLLQDLEVLRALLGLLGLANGHQAKAVALLLLRNMAAADARLAWALLELGALQQLQATPTAPAHPAPAGSSTAQLLPAAVAPFAWIQPGYWPEELMPSVEALARLLMGFMDQPPAQPQPAGQGPNTADSPPLTHTHLSDSSLGSAAAGNGALTAAGASQTLQQGAGGTHEDVLQQLPELQQQLQALQQLQQQRPQHDVQDVQMQAQGAVSSWLGKVEEGLPGLGYAPSRDALLLQGTLHGLSLVAAAAAAAGAGATFSSNRGGASGDNESGSWEAATVQRVSGAMLGLLRHHSPSVRDLLWQMLQSALESSAAGQKQVPSTSSSPEEAGQSPVVCLLLLPDVLECLVVEQLNSADAKPAVCRLLLCMLRCGGSSVAQRLLTWRPWISSCAGDAARNGLIAALAAFQDDSAGFDQDESGSDQAGGHWQQGFWSGEVAAVLQDLFSTKSLLRRDAGRQLLQVLVPGVEVGPDELHLIDDPFRGLLTSNDQASNSTLGAAASNSSSRFLLHPDTPTDGSAILAAKFSRQDVTSLLAVLANRGLAQELRLSAAEKLMALTSDADLLDVMVQQRHLEHIWQLCVSPDDLSDDEGNDTWREVDDASAVRDTGSGQSQVHVGAGDLSRGTFDEQLAIAGMQLLASLLARSNDALAWFARDPDRFLQSLMPLVLHAFKSVRKAVAPVLALALFGHAAQLWSSFAQAAAAAVDPPLGQALGEQRCMPLLPPGAQGVLLPLPFKQGFQFPFKVCWLPLGTSSPTQDAAAAVAQAAAGVAAAAAGRDGGGV